MVAVFRDCRLYERALFLQATELLTLLDTATECEAAAQLGPRQAIASLVHQHPAKEQREKWATNARAAAIIGSAPSSCSKVKTGLRRWSEFHCQFGIGPFLPPPVEDLLAVSRCFQVARTFTNYVAYLKLTCLLASLSIERFDRHPALKRAATAIDKCSTFVPREPLFIRQVVVARIADMRHSVPQQVFSRAAW